MRIQLVIAIILAAGCSQDDAATSTAQKAAEAAGAPTSAQVAAAQNAGSIDTGGHVVATLTGGKTASTETRDATFCVTTRSGMEVFVMVANNTSWSIAVMGMKGAPTTGEHPVGPSSLMATLTDKSSGTDMNAWQQYKGESGTITFDEIAADHAKGSFTFKAVPDAGGEAVTVSGTFDTPRASNCK